MNFYDRSSGRVRFQIQLQELEKSFWIEQRHRQMDGPLKCIFRILLPPIFKRHFQMDFLRSQGSRFETRAELIEHSAEKKCEWFKQYQRKLQFHCLFEDQ